MHFKTVLISLDNDQDERLKGLGLILKTFVVISHINTNGEYKYNIIPVLKLNIQATPRQLFLFRHGIT